MSALAPERPTQVPSAEPHRTPRIDTPRLTQRGALRIEQHRDGVVEVIALSGELDLAGAPAVAACVDAMRRDGRPVRVLVDLTNLEFCDSTGLRALIGAAGEVRAAGGRLMLSAAPGPVSRVLEIVGAAEWLDIHPDTPSALAALTLPRR